MKIANIKNCILQPRRLSLALMVCVSVSVFALQSGNGLPEQHSQQLAIEQLQQKIDELQNKNNELESEILECKEYNKTRESMVNSNLSLWFMCLTIIMAILGVAVPFLFNKSTVNQARDAGMKAALASQQANEAGQRVSEAQALVQNAREQVEKARRHANEANGQVDLIKEKVQIAIEQAKQATNAIKVIEGLTKSIDDIKKDIDESKAEINRIKQDINRDKRETEKYAQETENSYFNQILTYLSKPSKQLDNEYYSILFSSNLDSSLNSFYKALYSLSEGKNDEALIEIGDAIEKSPSDHRNYFIRGVIYMAMNEFKKAIVDFTQAISLKAKFKHGYLMRAKCYRKLAEKEPNAEKKADYLKKAQADEDKAKEL